MTIVASLRDEINLWRMAWQHIETFLSRTDEARTKDDAHATLTQALIKAAAALEYERALRDGSGLYRPLELDPEGMVSELLTTDPTQPPLAARRLPGAYDLEIAVAMMEPASTGHTVTLDAVMLLGRRVLFRRLDETTEALVEVAIPAYDANVVLAGDISVSTTLPYASLLDLSLRQSLVAVPPPSPPPAPYAWSDFRDHRASNRSATGSAAGKLQGVIAAILAPNAAPGTAVPSVADAASALTLLANACSAGVTDLKAAASSIRDAFLVGGLTDKDLSAAAADMDARGKAYADSAATLAGASASVAALPVLQTALAQLSVIDDGKLYASTGNKGLIEQALDEEVAARVACPDGTLRMLRTMEWALHRRWDAHLAWFAARLTRYLQPLLVTRFLGTFLSGLASVVGGTAPGAGIPSGMSVDPDRPATLGSNYVQLAPRGGATTWDVSGIVQGQVAYIDGPRRALVVLLGDGSAKPGANPQRLQVTPLRVSTARSLPTTSSAGAPRDTPGMIAAGTVETGRVPVSAADLKTGTVAGRPQDEGLPQSVVALWSRLCLLLGTSKVEAALKGAPLAAGAPGDVPSYLPSKRMLPLGLGDLQDPGDPVVSPHDRRLVVTIAALEAAHLDPDGPTQPVIARPGELLLVQGTDATGYTWQGVVEVVSIVRTTPDHIDDDPLLPPLVTQVCCNQPGTVLVIQVLDTTFPVPLVTASLHRDFQGFGPPSLATGVLLPHAVDPSDTDPAPSHEGVDRGPELAAACAVLSAWMWPPG